MQPDTARFPLAVEPDMWNVAFHPVAATPWMNRLPIGRFKHVSAFAYLAGLKGWVMYDVQLSATRIIVLPDLPASLDAIEAMTRGCSILNMKRQEGGATGARLGFWCVPALKHLIGIRSGALRPDVLWRDMLRNGASIVNDPSPIQAAREHRPRRGCPAGAGRQKPGATGSS